MRYNQAHSKEKALAVRHLPRESKKGCLGLLVESVFDHFTVAEGGGGPGACAAQHSDAFA